MQEEPSPSLWQDISWVRLLTTACAPMKHISQLEVDHSPLNHTTRSEDVCQKAGCWQRQWEERLPHQQPPLRVNSVPDPTYFSPLGGGDAW